MFDRDCRITCRLLVVVAFSLLACETDGTQPEEVRVIAQHLDACDVSVGKWQHLANLAVATAQEMGELNTSQQYSLVSWNHGEKVALSNYGSAICEARGGCPMVQGYLDLQELPNDVTVPQGLFNTIDYRNSLVDGYKRQDLQIDQLVANGRWEKLPEGNSIKLIGRDGTSACGTPAYAFSARRDFHFQFSTLGPIAGRYCTQITEPDDPHGWGDSYLCSTRALGLAWSSDGVIEGMTCVNVAEPTESAWNDNYLCTPEDWGLSFSHDGKPSDRECVAFRQPTEPSGWADNYLCWDSNAKLTHVGSLCQEFLLFGGAAACGGNNPYIDFLVSERDSTFKIDPTDYTQGSINTATTGQCFISMPLVSTNPDLVGSCCYQDGEYGYLVKYTTRPNTYYCMTS
jgi:hypothetical protein